MHLQGRNPAQVNLRVDAGGELIFASH